MKKIIIIGIVMLVIVVSVVLGLNKTEKEIPNDDFEIVTSFYPLYIITKNITEGVDGITVKNMTSNNIGCVHNYTLQPSDLKSISKANMFIINGLGMESFENKIKEEYKDLKIVDTSKADLNLINDSEGINGHVWNNLVNYREQVEYILEKLCENDPKNTEKYSKNAENYLAKLNLLKQNSYIAENNTYVISCNESLAYLLNGVGLKLIEVYTDHDQSALSSEKLKEIIEQMKEKSINCIFIEKNDDTKIAEILSKETGAKIYSLDANLSGEDNLDAYLTNMQKNYKIFQDCLK